MKTRLFTTIDKIRRRIAAERRMGRTIGLVPTMGALHAGHCALMEAARRESDVVVASIFVNPIQFDRPDDFQRYARTLSADLGCCNLHKVDLVFAPAAAEMYPVPQTVFAEVTGVTERLEGEFRPGHFRGVATVVLKLLNIVQPDTAYFGEKDAQQLAVIRRMAEGFNLATRIVPVATVREADGLAMSSRNQRLTTEQRRIAPLLYRALAAARSLAASGVTDAAAVKEAGLAVLRAEPGLRVEYFEVADAGEMRPVEKIMGPICIAAAAWLGETRLIDNVRLAAG